MSKQKGKGRAVPTITQDPRFASLHSDARFIKPKRLSQKIKVDDRFSNLLDDASADAPRIDKYGRKLDKSKSKKDLSKFYQMENALELARGQVLLESSEEEESDVESDEDLDATVELGRQSRASSEFSIDLDEDAALPLLSDSEEQEITTNRLAAVNLDWDHVRAIDLYKVFSSVFASASYSAHKVKQVLILSSDFGKERIKAEELAGPPAEIFADPEEINEKTIINQDEGAEYNEKRLRKYQLERLRYYYAVIEFNSVQACRTAFTEIQGTEFERSANIFDLRSIPDEMTFEESEAKDRATKDEADYEANSFTTDALRHSKVKLTWDQDDPKRSRLTRLDLSKLSKTDIDNMDFSTYLASQSETSESEGEAEVDAADPDSIKRDKLRMMLGLGDDSSKSKRSAKAPTGDMEITFMPAFSTGTDALTTNGDETSLDTYKRKEKERRQRKKEAKLEEEDTAQEDDNDAPDDFFEDASPAILPKERASERNKHNKKQDMKAKAELELLVASDEDGDLPGKHFDMNAILKQEKLSRSTKRKRNKAKAKQADLPADSFQLDAADDRFNAIHQDYQFAIDPSNPHFKKTKNMDKLLSETRKKRDMELNPDANEARSIGETQTDLDELVQSVKRKSETTKSQNNSKKRRL